MSHPLISQFYLVLIVLIENYVLKNGGQLIGYKLGDFSTFKKASQKLFGMKYVAILY